MGYNAFVGWAEESVWATLVARAQFGRPYEDSTPEHMIPREPEAILGYRDPERVFEKAQSGRLDIVVPLVYDGCGKLLKHCFGSVADAGADPYTHTFTLDDKPFTRATTPLVGLSAEAHLDLPDSGYESLLLHGGRVASFGTALRVNEEIKLRAALIGQKCISGAKTASPTFPDYDSHKVKPSQIVVELDSTEYEVAGIEFECDNALRSDRAHLGGSYIAEPRGQGKRGITGTIDLPWEASPSAKTIYDKFISGAEAAIVVTCTGPTNHSMVFRFPAVVLEGKTPGFQEGEDQDWQIAFRALRDDGTYGALEIVEENETATT